MPDDAPPWERLLPLLLANDYSAATLALVDLDDEERRSLRAIVDDYLRHRYDRPHTYGSEAGLGIVAAAVAPDARVLTRMLQRLYLGYWPGASPRSDEPSSISAARRRRSPSMTAVRVRTAARAPARGRPNRQRANPATGGRGVLAAEIGAALAAASGNVDYSYRRPSRRAAAVPAVVLPRLYRPVPEVAIAPVRAAVVVGLLETGHPSPDPPRWIRVVRIPAQDENR